MSAWLIPIIIGAVLLGLGLYLENLHWHGRRHREKARLIAALERDLKAMQDLPAVDRVPAGYDAIIMLWELWLREYAGYINRMGFSAKEFFDCVEPLIVPLGQKGIAPPSLRWDLLVYDWLVK